MNRKLPALSLLLVMIAPLATAGTLTPEQQLGKRLLEDVNLSLHRDRSCATCHTLAQSPGTVRHPRN